MLASLLLIGFVAHDHGDFTFDADGVTTITGPSQSGKSSIIEAVSFCLFGQDSRGNEFPVEAIRQGADRAEVELVVGWNQKRLRRTMTRKRSTNRSITDGADTSILPTEDAWRAQLGPIGARPDVARMVMVPMQWVPLLQKELGRPLRDLLLSLLPDVDTTAVITEMMMAAGHAMKAGDPTTLPGALSLQTGTNKNRDERKGALDSARDRLRNAGGAVVVPDPATLAAARMTSKADEDWRAYERLLDTHTAKLTAIARQTRVRDDWRTRRDGMGERPAYDAAALQAASQRAEKATAAHATAKTDHEVAGRAWTTENRKLTELLAASKCPTCDRAFDAAPDPSHQQDAVAVAKRQGDEARVVLDAAANEMAEARRALLPLQEHERKARDWDASNRTLGNEPSVEVAPLAPTLPDVARPAGVDVQKAEAVFAAHHKAAGAAERASAELAAAKAAATEAEAAYASADAEASRVAILVDACRRAPTEIAAKQTANIPDMGCFSFRFPPKETRTTPEIEVLIDGMPWWLASTGRQVVADLQFRAALRTLAGLDPLPLFVDRAQDWSEEWPTVEGPVIFLVTAPGALTVTSGLPVRVAA